MPKSDWCRKNMDRVNAECYGGELSTDTLRDTKLAIEFTKRAPFLDLQSTKSVNTIRTIKDPIAQGKVLEMVKAALAEGKDPRTGEKFKRQKGAFCITTPMIRWMHKYATTGTRPDYVKRGSAQNIMTTIPSARELAELVEELLACKCDRRTGSYSIPKEIMDKVKNLRGKISCNRHVP